jgi:acyl-CoA synthetase (AMP-forming)/AMP-acid ligase II
MDVVRAAQRHAGAIAVRAGGRAIRCGLDPRATATPRGRFECPEQPSSRSRAHRRYGDLLDSSERLAAQIAPRLPPRPPGAEHGPRIGVYAEPGFAYAASTWAAWITGGVAVPIAVSHPPAEIDYVIRDAGVSLVSVHS